MKQCSRCIKWKPPESFNKHGKKPDHLQPFCKQCEAEHKKNWRRPLLEAWQR